MSPRRRGVHSDMCQCRVEPRHAPGVDLLTGEVDFQRCQRFGPPAGGATDTANRPEGIPLDAAKTAPDLRLVRGEKLVRRCTAGMHSENTTAIGDIGCS